MGFNINFQTCHKLFVQLEQELLQEEQPLSQNANETVSSPRTAFRKFAAENAVIPKTTPDAQISQDLQSLNSCSDADAPAQLAKLYADIGGQGNLSSWRSNGAISQSLIDLCGSSTDATGQPLSTAISRLMDAGFQFQSTTANGTVQNDIPDRTQWEENDGYCGETSLQSAGLYYGQYISQYDIRSLATGGDQTSDELLLGNNDEDVADALHLQSEEFDSDDEENTSDFTQWIQSQVAQGRPVAIGVYMNQNDFYGNDRRNAGDSQYDHIVTVNGTEGNKIYFTDHGEWANSSDDTTHQFSFNTDTGSTRREANDPDAPPYSLPKCNANANNYGIAITGITDPNQETLPVHLLCDSSSEPNDIDEGSDDRPDPTQINLTGVVTGLTPGVSYTIYRYDDLSDVPDSDFNANSDQAASSYTFTATSSSFVIPPLTVDSDQSVIYRVVPTDGT